jgi:hypothetical protein
VIFWDSTPIRHWSPDWNPYHEGGRDKRGGGTRRKVTEQKKMVVKLRRRESRSKEGTKKRMEGSLAVECLSFGCRVRKVLCSTAFALVLLSWSLAETSQECHASAKK